VGKTTLAHIVATEMGVGIKCTSGPVLEKKGDLIAILTDMEEHEVLFIDEIHRLRTALEEILYKAMEDFQIDVVIGQAPAPDRLAAHRPSRRRRHDAGRPALNPLRNRFGITCHSTSTSPASCWDHQRSAAILKLRVEADAARAVASRSHAAHRQPLAAPAARFCQAQASAASTWLPPRTPSWRWSGRGRF
jgi:Holliday junction DNA helicase RuvB